MNHYIEPAFRCQAATNRGSRCPQHGRVYVDSVLVCLAHNCHGFIPFTINAEAQISDEQIARAQRVLEGP